MNPPLSGYTKCPVCLGRTWHVSVMTFRFSSGWVLGKCSICDFIHEIRDEITRTPDPWEEADEKPVLLRFINRLTSRLHVSNIRNPNV